MATSLMNSVQTISGNQPRIRDIAEAATQTFLAGTPVALNASGNVIAWNGTTYSTAVGAIIGVAKNPGKNLTTAGTPKQITQGSVPNQVLAQNIQRPYFDPDGATLLETANGDTIFQGQVGPSQSVTQANVGVQYGLTIDSDGHWYVDTTKTTVGTNTAVIVVKLDPNDQATVKRGVYFRFTGGVQPIS